MNSLISEGLDELGYENDPLLIEKLEIYLATLKKWNRVYNLTAIDEDSEIIVKHFLDSLSVNRYIQNSGRILDVGTGAGFPGLILALFNPKKSFVLVDGVSKKISFLQEMIGKLNLKNFPKSKKNPPKRVFSVPRGTGLVENDSHLGGLNQPPRLTPNFIIWDALFHSEAFRHNSGFNSRIR